MRWGCSPNSQRSGTMLVASEATELLLWQGLDGDLVQSEPARWIPTWELVWSACPHTPQIPCSCSERPPPCQDFPAEWPKTLSYVRPSFSSRHLATTATLSTFQCHKDPDSTELTDAGPRPYSLCETSDSPTCVLPTFTPQQLHDHKDV